MKVKNDYDFILACNAMDLNSYKNIDDEAIENELTKESGIEELIDRKSLFTKMSIEAQELFKIIFECPSEFLSIACTPKTNKISKHGVVKYSKFLHGKKKGIRIFKEVGKYVKHII
jgi:hypothetical protein